MGLSVRTAKRPTRSRCAFLALLAAAAVLLLGARGSLGDDGGDWSADGRLRYKSLGSDGRPQCADMDVDFPVTATTGLPTDEFIKTDGARFTIGECTEFIFSGWNQWEVLELASDAPSPFRWTPKCGREHIVNVMNEAAEAGLTVLRVCRRSPACTTRTSSEAWTS
mmetsp:Transcript_2474/g.8811  ORF Transcript_2474/g.8811 Transcript_2474/m.8811 type:complete len:166 (+) Transcript_2474:413-910(+)